MKTFSYIVGICGILAAFVLACVEYCTCSASLRPAMFACMAIGAVCCILWCYLDNRRARY